MSPYMNWITCKYGTERHIFTHTADSGDGDRAGDETEAFVYTDVQVCCPEVEKVM